MVVPDRPFFFRSPIWLTSLIPVLKWILMRSQEFLVLVSRSLLQNTPTVDLLSSNIQCLFNSFLSWLKAHSYQSPYFSSVDLTVAVTWSVGYPPPQFISSFGGVSFGHSGPYCCTHNTRFFLFISPFLLACANATLLFEKISTNFCGTLTLCSRA